MSDFSLVAPFAAWISRLGEVPDEAFAGGLLGDGLALDPLEGLVRAPCDGEVIALAATGHSVTLRHACGAEILVHVGVDTVELKGRGFERIVAIGSRVQAGDELLRFDLDLVAKNAKSVMTPLVVLGEEFHLVDTVIGCRVAAGQAIGTLRPRERHANAAELALGPAVQSRLRVPLANGVHARPAARIAAALKPYEAEVRIALGNTVANARSLTSLLKLDIRHGDEIRLEALGADAAAAIETLTALILYGLHEEPQPAPDERAVAPEASAEPGTLNAVRAAPGGALGVAVQIGSQDLPVREHGTSPAEEQAALAAALETLRVRLVDFSHLSDVAEAHLGILGDPVLREAIDRHIASGFSAPAAWRAVAREEAAALKAMGNAVLAERAADLIDVERQLIAILMGETARQVSLPENAIVLADELLPSSFLSLDLARVAGIATASGGATSHVAILAASRGVPMLVSCGRSLRDIVDGTRLVIETERAVLHIDPNDAEVARFRSEGARRAARVSAEVAAAGQECFTADGKRIEVFANCGSLEEALAAARSGAEGCGLLRTEFLFLSRQRPPSPEEQVESYARIAEALNGRPVILRTLDAGSDKPLAYLPMPHEENPALGARGIRLSLAHPKLLEEQFLAILKAVPAAQRRIMLPMVVDLTELRVARAILRKAEAQLGIAEPTPLGVMVETPAAALLADQLAREADFLSIGSNDLTQYTLAADRQNAATADALHPAVLRLIKAAAEGAHAHGRWLGVCGSIASDLAAAAVLIGLGVDELSVAPPVVPSVKARIRTLDTQACNHLAEEALKEISAADVRRLVEGGHDAFAL